MLYLDVDGVLNPDEQSPDTWPDWRRKKFSINHGGGLRTVLNIDWSPAMIQALWDVTGGAIAWHTSWNEDYKQSTFANVLLSPLFGWPQLPSVEGEVVNGRNGLGRSETGEWWKLTNLKRHVRDYYGLMGPRPRFVWIDDDFAFEPDAIEWVEANGGLAIITNPKVGLVPAHIDQIGHFLGT